jgi:hypothetical protein
MLCSIDRQFLHYNLPIGSQVGLVLLGHLSSKLMLVFLATLPGIPTLRGLGMEPSQKVSLPVMDLNGLKSIILQFEQKIINKYTVNYLKLQ